ncbi:hypothetical protein [Pedobacter hartonius]|uniref:Uncharacterized protein n=1 Tax=Pedobacter hartonius TaxID=425514 RepID=A0A1H4H5F0_9SPHI|nr:hypothetical protein [Pedobacter hartonius]SEB17024.1 hypothetical protein SAMN05443550_113130 [Pedobacter hartonius]
MLEQMKIDPERIIEVDYSGAAKALKPVVYKNRDLYCCIFGSNREKGVLGCGKTTEEALTDWDKNLKVRLRKAEGDDEIVQHVKTLLSNGKVANSLQEEEFISQFRPLKKH